MFIIYLYYVYNTKSEFYLKSYLKICVYNNKICYFYIYTCDCNVSWIYKHKDKQVNMSYSPSATFMPRLLYQLLNFLEKNVPSLIFWRINKTPIPIPFVKWRRSIKQNYLFHIFVTNADSTVWKYLWVRHWGYMLQKIE